MVHRVRVAWVTKYRMFVNVSIATMAFFWASPEAVQWYKYYVHELRWRELSLDEWKKQEKYRWKLYLKVWDPYHTGNMLDFNMGSLSNSRFDKIAFGKYRMEEPIPYEKAADDFIEYAEETGIDPALPLLETIKKMVKYYYPFDLDENPEETKRVLKPKVQWVYSSNFDDYVDKEENLPPPGSIARMCWAVPGMQDLYLKLYDEYQEKEQRILSDSSPEERVEYYQNLEHTLSRIGMEVDSYQPLLAYRWDRKQRFTNYMVQNPDLCEDILSRPGGLKQIFINAGIISPKDAHDFEQQRNFQYTGIST